VPKIKYISKTNALFAINSIYYILYREPSFISLRFDKTEMMTRGRKENSNETSPSPTLLLHGGVIDIPLNTDSGVTKNTPGEIALLRFKSVSKLWSSIISSRRDFIESIVTRFLTQPPHDAHFIFGFDSGPYVECFLGLSSTYPPNTDIEAVLSIPGRMAQYVYGLMCCLSGFKVVVYNPTTRQSFTLTRDDTLIYYPGETTTTYITLPLDIN